MDSVYSVKVDENIKKRFVSMFSDPHVPIYFKQKSVIEGYMLFYINRMEQFKKNNSITLDFIYNEKGEPYNHELRNTTDKGLLV